MGTDSAMRPFATRILDAFAGSDEVVIGVVDLEGHVLTGNAGLARVAGRPLEQLQRFFALLEGAIEEVFYVSDLAAGRLIYGSPGFECLWEQPVSALLGDVRLFMERIHPDDRPIMEQALARQLAPDGHVLEANAEAQRTLDLSVQAVLTPNGDVRYLLAEGLDITQRLEERRRRDEAEQRLALAIEATSEGVWDWQLAEGAAFYSPRWCRNLGYTPSEVRPQVAAWCELVHPEDQEGVCAAVRGLREGAIDRFRLEVRLRRRDGSWMWSLARAQVVAYDGRGQPQRVVGTDTDIEPLKRAESQLRELNGTLEQRIRERTEALERASRAKDEFLAVMSHELRTPLMAILGIAEAVEEGIYGPVSAAQREAIGLLGTSGQHLLTLISDLLDLSKLVNRQLPFACHARPVDAFVSELAPRAQELAQRSGKQVAVSVYGQPGHFEVDPVRLRQVLVSLLANALKFSSPAGVVRLDVQCGDHTVTFTVTDDGPGVYEDDLPRLFRPFEQLDMQLARRYGGVGLGLALVHRLVAMHGGQVQVTNGGEAGGRFAVTVPRVHQIVPGLGGQGLRVLLVGDADQARSRSRCFERSPSWWCSRWPPIRGVRACARPWGWSVCWMLRSPAHSCSPSSSAGDDRIPDRAPHPVDFFANAMRQ